MKGTPGDIQKKRHTFTIDKKVAVEFKETCNRSGLQYSNVVEVLMRQFSEQMKELTPLFKGGLENVRIADLLAYIERVKDLVEVKPSDKEK